MKLVIRREAGLVSAPRASYEDEAELARVLAEEPDLLRAPGDGRLALIGRQVPLADAGTLDLLFADEDGLPVAVEVKLARNGEARRQVVAQAVDYLSALMQLTADELDLQLNAGVKKALERLDDGPGGDQADENDELDAPGQQNGFARRWQAFAGNLRAGRARLIVALDEAPPDLRRIMQFLAERSRLDIRLVTISKFGDPGVGAAYVPTVIVGGGPEPPPLPGRPTPEEWLQRWSQSLGPDGPRAAAAWGSLVTSLTQHPSGAFALSHFPGGGPYVSLTGAPGIALVRLVDRKPFMRDVLHRSPPDWVQDPAAAAARDRFRQALLQHIPRARVNGAAGRVEAPIMAMAEADTRNAVVQALTELAAQLRSLPH